MYDPVASFLSFEIFRSKFNRQFVDRDRPGRKGIAPWIAPVARASLDQRI